MEKQKASFGSQSGTDFCEAEDTGEVAGND